MFFFFKQKTAYEMRISDWSSDVCSSDLAPAARSGEFLSGGVASPQLVGLAGPFHQLLRPLDIASSLGTRGECPGPRRIFTCFRLANSPVLLSKIPCPLGLATGEVRRPRLVKRGLKIVRTAGGERVS